MKKLFLVLAAAFAMVACQTDINEVGVVGGEVDVTFEVGTPTRAYSDGTTATVLQYAVYEGTDELEDLTVTDGEIHGSTKVELKLVTGNTYTVIFWAAAPNAPYSINWATGTMTVDYSAAVCNAENRDAFYKRHTFTVKGAQTETIELRRPFAQLNIGTNDYTASANAGYTPNQSKVKVTNIYSTLNLWDGTVDGATAVEFAYADIKRDETFPVAAAADAPAYEYLAMNYLLVASEKEVVDVEFTYNETDTNDAKTRVVGSVPVQRNYRTNIYGQLLTSDVDINVVIKPAYDEPAYTADALFHAAAFGGEVTLTEDVVLTSALNVQSNMTIDLNGKTITAPSGDGYAITNEGGATLQITNGKTRTATNGGVINGIVYTGENSTTIINGGTFNALNGGAYVFLNSKGTLTINQATINGGTSYPVYSYNEGNKLVINNATINGTFGCINAYGVNGEVVINGGTFQMTGVQGNTSHIAYFSTKVKAIINGGTFEKIGDISMSATGGGGICVNGGANLTINGGNFAGDHEDVYNYGGTYSILGGTYKFQPANVAAGYKALQKGNLYYVVAEEIDAIVANAVELNKSVLAITDGGVITITDDFNFTTEEGGYYNNGGWKDGFGYSGDKSFTIDLNGKTIGNANGALNDYLLWFKNDGEKPNTITIKNGTLDAGTTAYCALATASSNKQTITINLENVNLINNISNGSTVKLRGHAVLNVKAGAKITGKNSYLGIECVASTVNIYDGAEIYQNGTSSYNGCLVGACGNGVVNVYGGYGKGVKGCFIAMTSGGTINVHGGEWIANTDGTVGNNSNLYALTAQNNKYENGWCAPSIINVTGGTLRGGMDAWVLNDVTVEKAELNISGGNFNANPTHYLTDGVTATEDNGVWTVK